MGAVGFFPSHVWGWGLVGFLVWVVFWVVLGWEQWFFVVKLCWMGWDRMGDTLGVKNKLLNIAYVFCL